VQSTGTFCKKHRRGSSLVKNRKTKVFGMVFCLEEKQKHMPKTFSAKALILSIFWCAAPQTGGNIFSKYDKTLHQEQQSCETLIFQVIARIKGAEHRNILHIPQINSDYGTLFAKMIFNTYICNLINFEL